MRALCSLEGPGNCSGSLPSGKAGATTLKLFAVSLRTRAGDGLARPPWSHFTTAKKIQEPGLLDPDPLGFLLALSSRGRRPRDGQLHLLELDYLCLLP